MSRATVEGDSLADVTEELSVVRFTPVMVAHP